MKFRPIIGKLPKHRQFNYTPRYYKPEKGQRQHREFHFKRKARRGQTRSVFFYALLLFFALWLVLQLA